VSVWDRQYVILKLSDKGRAVFAGVLDDSNSLPVEFADESGLWVVADRQPTGEITMLLVKWEHFDSAQMTVFTEPPPAPKLMGFKR
jgi:hypothetical protein